MKKNKLKNRSLDIEKLRKKLKTTWLGRNLYHFMKTDSTNNVAKALAEQGAQEGTIIIAETQTYGRGRLGRKWESPKGGVWLSIILKPKLKMREIVKINLLTAVAVAKTIREEFKLNAEVKWPNDVLIDQRKVCGILEGDEAKYVILGIGINANFELAALPENLRATATSLKDILGKEVDREKFICNLLKNFEIYYEKFKEGKTDLILNDWRKLSCILDRNVQISDYEKKFEGMAIDIDKDGYLIVKLNNGILKKILSADVTLRLTD